MRTSAKEQRSNNKNLRLYGGDFYYLELIAQMYVSFFYRNTICFVNVIHTVPVVTFRMFVLFKTNYIIA